MYLFSSGFRWCNCDLSLSHDKLILSACQSMVLIVLLLMMHRAVLWTVIVKVASINIWVKTCIAYCTEIIIENSLWIYKLHAFVTCSNTVATVRISYLKSKYATRLYAIDGRYLSLLLPTPKWFPIHWFDDPVVYLNPFQLANDFTTSAFSCQCVAIQNP